MGVRLTFEEKETIFLKKFKERYQDKYPEFNFKISETGSFKGNDEFVFIEYECEDIKGIWKTKPRYMNGERLPLDLSVYIKKKNGFKEKKRTPEEFREEFYTKFEKDEYELLSEFVGVEKPIKLKHNRCGRIYETIPKRLLKSNPSRCKFCFGKYKRTVEEYNELLKLNDLNDYQVESIFNRGNQVYGNFIHLSETCNNHKFVMRISDMLSSHNQRCPKCAMINTESQGTKTISEFLENNEIKFEKECTLKGLRYVNNLRIDFHIIDLDLYLEFDGIQHFKRSFGATKEEFEAYQLRDKIKDDYFQKNKLKFDRIRFDQDIVERLKEILTKNGYAKPFLE